MKIGIIVRGGNSSERHKVYILSYKFALFGIWNEKQA